MMWRCGFVALVFVYCIMGETSPTPVPVAESPAGVFWSLMYVLFVLLFGGFCFMVGCVVALRKSTERRLNSIEQHQEEPISQGGFAAQLEQQSLHFNDQEWPTEEQQQQEYGVVSLQLDSFSQLPPPKPKKNKKSSSRRHQPPV